VRLENYNGLSSPSLGCRLNYRLNFLWMMRVIIDYSNAFFVINHLKSSFGTNKVPNCFLYIFFDESELEKNYNDTSSIHDIVVSV
jgi:hypothetical protein